MDTSKLNSLTRMVYGLILLFITVFIIGLFGLGGEALLINASLLSILAIILLIKIYQSEITGRIKTFLMASGISSISFSLGLTYGIFGIWGYYSIYNPIYIGLVGVSLLLFVTSTIAALLWLGRNK